MSWSDLSYVPGDKHRGGAGDAPMSDTTHEDTDYEVVPDEHVGTDDRDPETAARRPGPGTQDG